MSEPAEQVVLEYLSRANDAAHRYLGSRERLDFVTRLRQRIEEHRAQVGGATKPDEVRKVLARFGDPEALVRRERRRLDEVVAAADTAADGTDAGRVDTGRGDAAGGPAKAAAADPGATAGGEPAAARTERLREARPDLTQPRWSRRSSRRSSRREAPPGAGRGWPPRPRGTPQRLAPQPLPPVRVAQGGAVDMDELLRLRPVEAGAIALLGVGGLVLPAPLWIFAAAAAVLSRVWTAREKMIALVVPPLVIAVAVAARDGVDAFGGLGRGHVPSPLRLAGPVGAGYLTWRLLRAIGARTVRFTRGRARGR